ERKTGNVVAGCGVRVHQAKVLAFEVLHLLVGTVLLDVEDGVITLGAVAVDLDGEGLRLDARQQRTGERGRSVHADMDVAGALTFDQSRIVVGDAQGDLRSKLIG